MFVCMALTPEFIEDVRTALKASMREAFGKQEAAAFEVDCDPAQLSRDLNGPAAVFVARCAKLGILPKTLERIGATHTLKSRLDDHERRLTELERKPESA